VQVLAVDADFFSEDFNWGYTGFDDIGAAFLTIFQVRGWKAPPHPPSAASNAH
jgi:hypothetical protein